MSRPDQPAAQHPGTCDASTTFPGILDGAPTQGGPCVLRHGHDGPWHKGANGMSWALNDPVPPVGAAATADASGRPEPAATCGAECAEGHTYTGQCAQAPPVGATKPCRHCGKEIVYKPYFLDARGPNPPVWWHPPGSRTCSTLPDNWGPDETWPIAEPEEIPDSPAVSDDAQSGVDTPGCDCGHDGMGPKWHRDACEWLSIPPCDACGMRGHSFEDCPPASDDGPSCRYCNADCSDGRSWDGGDLYTCGPCSDQRAACNQKAASDDELTADEARELADELGRELYRAQDALAFVGECCVIADREQRPVTTAMVREWLKGARCGRQLAADHRAATSDDELREQLVAAIENEIYEYRERTMFWDETGGVTQEIARLATRAALTVHDRRLQQLCADLAAETVLRRERTELYDLWRRKANELGADLVRVRDALDSFDGCGVIAIGHANLDIPSAGDVLAAVRAALDGQTDPAELGLPEETHAAFLATLDGPAPDGTPDTPKER